MIGTMEITTKSGKKKIIRGQRNALRFRIEVREMFDKLLAEFYSAKASYSGICAMVAKEKGVVPQRVYAIMKNDFGYTTKNYRNGQNRAK